MHYSKTAFRNGTEPTIVTNIPYFMDVIGQRMDFSDYDLQKLNQLYNCCKFLHLFYILCFLSYHPASSKKIYVNIFGEMNCVKNTRKNGTARNNIALLQKHCCVAELSMQFYLTFS